MINRRNYVTVAFSRRSHYRAKSHFLSASSVRRGMELRLGFLVVLRVNFYISLRASCRVHKRSPLATRENARFFRRKRIDQRCVCARLSSSFSSSVDSEKKRLLVFISSYAINGLACMRDPYWRIRFRWLVYINSLSYWIKRIWLSVYDAAGVGEHLCEPIRDGASPEEMCESNGSASVCELVGLRHAPASRDLVCKVVLCHTNEREPPIARIQMARHSSVEKAPSMKERRGEKRAGILCVRLVFAAVTKWHEC